MKHSKKAVLRIVTIFAVLICITGVFGKFILPQQSSKPAESPNSVKKDEIISSVTEYQKAVEDFDTNGMKAMWISYLEYQNLDFSSMEIFKQQISEIFTNCKNIGMNTVIVHARAFGDAFYKSDYFPYSHIMTGTQGVDIGYDPLEIMVDVAHEMGLRIEAWVNPYRVKLGNGAPSQLSADNPACDETLVLHIGDDIYYNPALPQVQQLVVNGVVEIVEKYNVDGIHFDDYFYPTTDLTIDQNYYLAYSGNLSQEDWRRENVNELIRSVYAAIKQLDGNVTFGISPQGNDSNNYNIQYSDIALWLKTPGYVDYIMPQLYWGFDYRTSAGRDDFAFKALSYNWSQYKKADGVKLYIGLGAYRIGDGDGGNNSQDEWQSGENLSRMIDVVKANPNIDGYALYRYDSLFSYNQYEHLQKAEAENITKINNN